MKVGKSSAPVWNCNVEMLRNLGSIGSVERAGRFSDYAEEGSMWLIVRNSGEIQGKETNVVGEEMLKEKERD